MNSSRRQSESDTVQGASLSDADVDVTVAICTWNRAELLKRTLQSLTRLEIPTGIRWELLVVNNNCTDTTDDVVASNTDQLPIRILHEPQQGHAHCRNRVIDEARGELILWTDDDVSVEHGWLSAYWSAAVGSPEIGFWGGTIVPDFESEPPQWVNDNWEICSKIYALRQFESTPPPMDDRNLPFGANFAIRTELQRDFRYNTDFGRKASGMRGFDEIDVFRRLLDSGHRGEWCTQAKLAHFIPRDRLSLGYIRRYFIGQGEIWALRGNCTLTPRQLRFHLWRNRVAYQWRRHLRPATEWLPHLIEASRLLGQLRIVRHAS